MDKETQTPEPVVAPVASNIEQLAAALLAKQVPNVTPPAAPVVTDVANLGEVITKGGFEQPQGQTNAELSVGEIDPLRKSFEGLAVASKNYRYLGDRNALENPHETLSKMNSSQLNEVMGGMLLNGMRNGTPVNKYFGAATNDFEKGVEAMLSKGQFTPEVAALLSKALDTTTGAALIREDIDPVLRFAYNRRFPLYERLRKFPANGKTFTYNVMDAPPTASLVAETAQLSGILSNGTYSKPQVANIAIGAAMVQNSFKEQFAVRQGGMAHDLTSAGNLEVTGALNSLAQLNQAQALQGNFSTPGGTLGGVDGLYNALGMDGLRTLLKVQASTHVSTELYFTELDQLIGQIQDEGGNTEDLMILCSNNILRGKLNKEIQANTSYQIEMANKSSGVSRNVTTAGLVTFGDIVSKVMPIPAKNQSEGIGYYTVAAADHEDVFVVDPNAMGLAYLGSPAPIVLELPSAFDTRLADAWIVFFMNGLCVYIKKFHRKLQIPRA